MTELSEDELLLLGHLLLEKIIFETRAEVAG